MKTVRRDWLLRRAREEKLVLVSSYSFDDAYGASRTNKEMPVRLRPDPVPEGWYPAEGTVWLRPDHFTGYGRAYWSGKDTVHLTIHSNLNYDFRVLP